MKRKFVELLNLNINFRHFCALSGKVFFFATIPVICNKVQGFELKTVVYRETDEDTCLYTVGIAPSQTVPTLMLPRSIHIISENRTKVDQVLRTRAESAPMTECS